MLTDDQLRDWQELCDRATAPPWKCDTDNGRGYIGDEYGRFYFAVGPLHMTYNEKEGQGAADVDAAFMKAARDAMPALLTEVARLRAALDIARDAALEEAAVEAESHRIGADDPFETPNNIAAAIRGLKGAKPS